MAMRPVESAIIMAFPFLSLENIYKCRPFLVSKSARRAFLRQYLREIRESLPEGGLVMRVICRPNAIIPRVPRNYLSWVGEYFRMQNILIPLNITLGDRLIFMRYDLLDGSVEIRILTNPWTRAFADGMVLRIGQYGPEMPQYSEKMSYFDWIISYVIRMNQFQTAAIDP